MEIERSLRQFWQGWSVEVEVRRTSDLDRDGNQEVVCSTCKKPILGSAIRYKNNSGFFHFSCLNFSTWYESPFLHFSSGHDDLIFTKKVKNEGRKNAVCFACEGLVVGRGYECSTSECRFLLHQSCAEQPPQMQHDLHPGHTIYRFLPVFSRNQDENRRTDCEGFLSYRCVRCDFRVDFLRAIDWPTIDRDDCQHKFSSFFKRRMQFTCDACGEEGKEIAFLCSICQLLIHRNCHRFSRAIKIWRHPHPLTITYSLREVREVKNEKNIFCNLCYEKIKTEYGAYCCNRCDFVAHMKCAYDFFRSVCEGSDDLDSDDEEQIEGAEETPLFCHRDHILNLCTEELKDNIRCDGCMELISAPFYSCTKCNYFLHDKCFHLPRKKTHILHDHMLTLVTQQRYFGGVFRCKACGRESQGFCYRCDECAFNLDIKCSLMPEVLEHGSHPHSLYLAINSPRECNSFESCCRRNVGVFVCTTCEFAFCFKCATLPSKARYPYHKHLLQFTYAEEINSEDYYCLICEEQRNQRDWIYYCTECDFPAHIECVIEKYPYMKFENFFTNHNHEHPLTFVLPDEFFRCNVCNRRTFDDVYNYCHYYRYYHYYHRYPGKAGDYHAIHCAQCEFIVHRGCLGVWEGLRSEKISLNPAFLSPLVPNEQEEEIDSGAEEAAGTSTSIASVDEVGGTSAGTRGQRDSVEEIDSGAEDAGGTSMGAKGRGDLGKVIESVEIEEIDSSTEEREGLVQAPEAAAEIDSGMEDAGGTTAGTRVWRDLGKGIDDVEEINSIVEIDSGVEVTGN